MADNLRYQVNTAWAGQGFDRSAYVCVVDQYDRVWSDRSFDRDQYCSDREFRAAVMSKARAYHNYWVKKKGAGK